MKRHVYDERGTTLIRIEEAEPVCGEDFCERCGDCLSCYRDGCYSNGEWTAGVECFWVQYGERGA